MREAPETVARQVKVGAAILGEIRPAKAKSRRPFGVVAKMTREIESLVRHRANTGWTGWVRPLADLMVPSIGIDGFVHHVLVIAPDLAPAAAEIAETAEAAIECRTYWSATSLGRALDLTRDERKALGITTVRAVGMTRTEQAAAKRQADAERQARKRREAGSISRSIWIANSTEEEARRFGVSSRTVRRRRAKAKAKAADCPRCVATNYPRIASDAPRTPDETGALGRARSPAAALAEVVMRSTGHRPSAVVVEGDEALVLLDPARVREGPILAPHLAGTLAELGIEATARFDGKAAVFLTFERAAA